MVVEHRRAAGERELGEARLRGRVLGLGVDPRPDGIEGLQPGEEVGLLGAGARERLVQVVVRVDEAGSDESAAEILAVVRLRLGTPADLAHDAVLDQHPARLVLGARVVHHDDVRVGEEVVHASTIPLTACRPVISDGCAGKAHAA